MTEPAPLAETTAALLAEHPSERLQALGRGLAKAKTILERRRGAILSHPDLASQLTQPPLSFTRPSRWNGYIPPALWPLDSDDEQPGGGELLRSARMARNGQLLVRYNQRGARSCGTQINNAPQRAALLELAAEAWRREQAAAQ